MRQITYLENKERSKALAIVIGDHNTQVHDLSPGKHEVFAKNCHKSKADAQDTYYRTVGFLMIWKKAEEFLIAKRMATLTGEDW